VVVDHFGCLAPTPSSILEIADQFFFLGIYADYWPAVAQKELFLRLNVLKLRFAIRVLRASQPLVIGFERIVSLLL
jgi:hypothetical protein